MEDFIVETRYLIEDLRDINGMKQAHFINILGNIERNEILSGIRFEVDSRRLADVLKRLRDRLYFRPLETLFLIQIGDIRLQVETSKYRDLSGLMTAVQDRLLFYPESEYLQGHFILDLGDEFRWFQPSKTKIADDWNRAFS